MLSIPKYRGVGIETLGATVQAIVNFGCTDMLVEPYKRRCDRAFPAVVERFLLLLDM